MPSVGMRRSTRVFGTRVLRSGRRLWTEPYDSSKYTRASHLENKWVEFSDNSADGGGDVGDRCKDTWQDNGSSASMDVDSDPRIEEREPEGVMRVKSVDKMFGIMYSRKRKRVELANTGLMEDRRYGKKFERKQWMKRCRSVELFRASGEFRDSVRRCQEFAIFVNGSSRDCDCWITCFLTSVLSYMTRVKIEMRHLLAFVLSKPICDAYSSRGVLFIQDSITAKKPVMRIISGSRSRIPLFRVDFSSIPSFFVHIQTIICMRSAHLACLLVAHSLDLYEKVADVADNADESSFQIPSWRGCRDRIAVASHISPERDVSYTGVVASNNDNSGAKESSPLAVGVPKSALRSFGLRSSRTIQKRRSSPRHKRGRQPSTFRAREGSEALVSDVLRIKQDGIQLSGSAPSRVLRSSDKRTLNSNTTQDACPTSCSANLLIAETDRCYRVEGATITLESSASSRWFLAVTKDGTKRYSLMAEKVMRPPGSNRFTHDIVWATGDGWKLEFPNKQDWLIFKEFFKECCDRNMQLSAASVIPVPGVQEVSDLVDADYVPYVRPDSYITIKDDELTRALAKNTAIFDMDSDDDEWLAKLNDELYEGTELQERVKPESFELIIDALEKGFHCNPDEHFDGKAAYEFCMHLERREVIEAVRSYWIKKRKQKRSALVRIFQLYHPRRNQVILKSVSRKKRSTKRQASKVGRGKQRPFLQAIAAEREAMEQQKNVQKVQEAKAVADRSEGLAILKRQRAQVLMENADLATYKATMALKIAEAAQISKTAGIVSPFFLG